MVQKKSKMEKIRISTDTLYKYLVEHNFILSVLSDYMKVSNSILMASFRHDLNRCGKPTNFSVPNLRRLNNALAVIADDLRKCVLVFGSDKMFTNQYGRTYDPGMIEAMKNGAGKFFKLRGMTERLLGWNKGKWGLTMYSLKSAIYGNITRDDTDRINAELLAVAGVLSSYEVVADEDHSVKQETEDVRTVLSQSVTEDDDAVPVSETTYTLDDLYQAFGEDRKASAARLRYALERNGITTLQELAALSVGRLLDMEGVGSGTLGLIHKAFKKLGVRW